MTRTLLNSVRDHAVRLDGNLRDYEELLDQVGERSLVLLGESTHGTSEFYHMRAQITQRLIEEKGFDAVAVEADWPDAYRLNRFALGIGDEESEQAFADFERFPRWMWRNRDVLRFIEWLAAHNDSRDEPRKAGFYGLDLYSMYRSAAAVAEYLEKVDPEQATLARKVYECLDHVRDPQQYGFEAASGLRPDCREALQEQLVVLSARDEAALVGGGLAARDEQFYAEHNAQVVKNAEAYYRGMFGSRINTWNLRDEHMAATLLKLQRYRRERGGVGKVVVWAHNSHVGDARATEMNRRRELNLGQLARQQAGEDQVVLVGFTTYTGRVAAAHDWDGEVEHFQLRPALPESFEDLFHRSRVGDFFLRLDTREARPLRDLQLERAVGVIYRPRTERASHYFEASLAAQFDAVFHVDESHAVEPFDLPWHWHEERDMPETWPTGL